ncbi:MAG: DUF5615 family PIN-like protein, partial [Candidatus Omnitrophica bacterium]|nr:DUF5615 family PIN-like protein [Candidatus Omnitrophota bacterium]
DVYKITVDFLRLSGYEVVTASELGLSRASDSEILKTAYERKLVLITRDKGFGALFFLGHLKNCGIIRLKIEPENILDVHEELTNFIKKHGQLDLKDYFVVIEPGRHRIRGHKKELN